MQCRGQEGREELVRWREITRKMRIAFHGDGIISQFEGYETLEGFDWEGYRQPYGDSHRLDRILGAEGDTPDRYKVSKQADVLMLFYLFSSDELGALCAQLRYPFAYETIPNNVDYYLGRTSHSSTLSRIVHSLGAGAIRSRPLMAPLHRGPGERRQRQAGRHHARGHSFGRDGGYRRSRTTLL